MSEGECQCRQCIRDRGDNHNGDPLEVFKMILCQTCGNKRCPHATDHRIVAEAKATKTSASGTRLDVEIFVETMSQGCNISPNAMKLGCGRTTRW